MKLNKFVFAILLFIFMLFSLSVFAQTYNQPYNQPYNPSYQQPAPYNQQAPNYNQPYNQQMMQQPGQYGGQMMQQPMQQPYGGGQYNPQMMQQQPQMMGGMPPLPQPITNPQAAFATGYIRVIGESEAGQRRYAALRAAKVVAQRDLLEVIQGVTVAGDTTVQNGLLVNDVIRSTVQGFLQGARECGRYYDMSQGVGYVCLEVGTKSFVTTMFQDPNARQAIFNAVPPAPVFQPQIVPPAPQVYDGLIVDTTGTNFRPALINRILNEKGEIIYDPTKIAEDILAQRGCGDYTNEIGKAKAILSERGVRNPLVVKAVGVVKFTDVKVSGDDATAIFSSNQKTNFLEGAKVVFVLK
ncbi:conserved hypothetical protein [Deferribacter desulfuricans SSM1]|uniref:Uncharacterized protein n=1 Tax=Deferribacter desulfuricans (strain DSM 14783 / JCM 11476 / NBRC 101012 / SSM1) TaxID=639282 RepID=D3PE49_DEFDS|nr:hypothetical protein [Deferribacter desulfuricans]BAI80872.1 conserved hypothetical protein [Deferribacter desulfuricans SSM1]